MFEQAGAVNFSLNWQCCSMDEEVKISIEQIIAMKPVLDFVEAAKCFCLLIETQQSNNPKEFLELLHKQLLTLYKTGIDLPGIFIENEVEFDIDLPKYQMQAIIKFISKRVPFSYYSTVLNPFEIDAAKTAIGDLTDDLGDIYLDLKRTLMKYDNESTAARRNTLWQFKFDFDNHWQEHCIDAIQIIFHYLLEHR